MADFTNITSSMKTLQGNYQANIASVKCTIYENALYSVPDAAFLEKYNALLSEIDSLESKLKSIQCPSNYKTIISDVENLVGDISSHRGNLSELTTILPDASKKAFDELVQKFNELEKSYTGLCGSFNADLNFGQIQNNIAATETDEAKKAEALQNASNWLGRCQDIYSKCSALALRMRGLVLKGLQKQ